MNYAKLIKFTFVYVLSSISLINSLNANITPIRKDLSNFYSISELKIEFELASIIGGYKIEDTTEEKFYDVEIDTDKYMDANKDSNMKTIFKSTFNHEYIDEGYETNKIKRTKKVQNFSDGELRHNKLLMKTKYELKKGFWGDKQPSFCYDYKKRDDETDKKLLFYLNANENKDVESFFDLKKIVDDMKKQFFDKDFEIYKDYNTSDITYESDSHRCCNCTRGGLVYNNLQNYLNLFYELNKYIEDDEKLNEFCKKVCNIIKNNTKNNNDLEFSWVPKITKKERQIDASKNKNSEYLKVFDLEIDSGNTIKSESKIISIRKDKDIKLKFRILYHTKLKCIIGIDVYIPLEIKSIPNFTTNVTFVKDDHFKLHGASLTCNVNLCLKWTSQIMKKYHRLDEIKSLLELNTTKTDKK